MVSTARAVQYMLETARKLGVGRPGGEMQILLISPVEITEDRLTFKENDVTDERSIANSRALGAHMKIVAEQLGVEFLDAAQYIKPGKVDGVHLDEKGHARLAELVYEKLRDAHSRIKADKQYPADDVRRVYVLSAKKSEIRFLQRRVRRKKHPAQGTERSETPLLKKGYALFE